MVYGVHYIKLIFYYYIHFGRKVATESNESKYYVHNNNIVCANQIRAIPQLMLN